MGYKIQLTLEDTARRGKKILWLGGVGVIKRTLFSSKLQWEIKERDATVFTDLDLVIRWMRLLARGLPFPKALSIVFERG